MKLLIKLKGTQITTMWVSNDWDLRILEAFQSQKFSSVTPFRKNSFKEI